MPWHFPGLPRLGVDIGGSNWFKLAATKAFAEVDVDGDAKLDYKELYIALLRLYDVLNAKLPAHIKVPNVNEVNRLMRKYDVNDSGKLEEEEFMALAKSLLGTRKDWRESILLRCTVAVVLKTVGFPFMASFVEKVFTNNGVTAPPPAVLAFGIETVFKQIAA